MKKKMSMLLALVMVFSLCCPAYAASDTAKDNTLISTVQDVVTREHGDMLVASRVDWLPLEDISGTEYAYFIPLKSGDTINGYSVVSHVGSSNKVLKTASGPVSSGLAVAIIRTASDNDVARIIYEFPSAFLAEKNNSYYKICTSGTLNPVNAEDYNKTNAAYFTSASEANQNQTREEITYGELDDCTVGSFIPIPASNGGYYYGGYQDWLTEQGVSQFYANRSCGVTAAANVMYYMATHISGKSALYNQTGSLTKAKFNAFQRSVYDYLNPSIIGVPTLNSMINGVVDYAASRGVTLTPITSPASWTHSNVLNYMRTGLNAESPVLVLNWNSPIADLDWHWVTVTKIYGDNVSMYMVTSNWGERETYDFNTWVNGSSVYKGTIYFV